MARRRGRIPKSIAKAIDARIASLEIVNRKQVIKEVGIYFIECTMIEWSDNTLDCAVWVIKKTDYSDDPIENVLMAVDGWTGMHNKDEANRKYLELRAKYNK
jgi:hypothetical protein